MHQRTCIAAALLLLAGRGWAAAPGQPIPDTLFADGRIHTGAAGGSAEAIMVENGRIVVVGREQRFSGNAAEGSGVRGLGGRIVLPLFYGGHVQVSVVEEGMPTGNALAGPEDLPDLQARPRARGTGSHEPIPTDRLSTRRDPDAAVSGKPVALKRGPGAGIDSLALKGAWIDRDWPQPREDVRRAQMFDISPIDPERISVPRVPIGGANGLEARRQRPGRAARQQRRGTWMTSGNRSWAMRAIVATALVAVSSGAMAAANGVAVPDKLYLNGHIYTGKGKGFVEAVAVKDGKVLAAGTAVAMRSLAGPGTTTQDLGGKTVLPGFYDNHVHVGLAERADMATPGPDLKEVQDLRDLQDRLRKFAATVPAGTWIRASVPHGTGEAEPFPEDKLPTRWQLDEAAPNHPVALNRGHLMLVNSAALKIAGIARGAPQPPGGRIDMDAKGEPIGVLRETPARRMITSKFPKPPKMSDQAGLDALRKRLKSQLALGVTSLNVPGMRPGDDLRLMQTLYAGEGADLPRATIQLRVSPGYDVYDDPAVGVKEVIKEIESLSFFTGFGDDRIKIGAIKMSVDGAFSGQAAWLMDDYPGRPGYHGVIRIPPEALYAVGKRAHDLGWQLGVHAIGDQAVKETVDVLDRILKESPRPDARHYIHHISVKPPQESLEKMKKNGIIASMQPNFTYTIAPFYKLALSPAKLQTNNPEKSIHDMGIRMSIGSDNLPDGPLVGIFGAVTRRGIDGSVNGPAEKMNLEDAIDNATVGSAYQTFDEKTRGTLQPGMVADMVVLSQDIFKINPEQIRTLKPVETIIAGKTVWTDDGSAKVASNLGDWKSCIEEDAHEFF